MPAIGEETDRRLAELAIERGLVDPKRARAAAEERTLRIARGERVKPLAVVLCDMGLLDRARAAALLKEVRAEKRSGVHETLPLPGLARPKRLDTTGRIGKYAIVRELGKGGMGIVYEALDTVLKRSVAIKMILDPSRADPETLERFRREAQSAARVPHPGIVQVFETGEHEGKPFLVMELVAGESFEALLKRETVPPRRVVEIVRGVALALEHAHAHQIVHRDVKPANVLLDRQGKPHLTDFGLARDEAVTAQLTVTGDVLGTPAYMAPEQASGVPGAQGPHTDVYALGGLLYRALTGKPPFEAANAQALLYKVLTQEPAPLRRVKPTVHQDLETISLRCLAKEPARRYATAGAVAEELRRFLDGEPILARPAGPLERARRLVRRHRLMSAAVVVLSVAALWAALLARSAGRRSAVESAGRVAREKLEAFHEASKRDSVPYEPNNVDTMLRARAEFVQPGIEALMAAVLYRALAEELVGDGETRADARRLVAGIAAELEAAALENDDTAVARFARARATEVAAVGSRSRGSGDDFEIRCRAADDARRDVLLANNLCMMGERGRGKVYVDKALAHDRRCAAALYLRAALEERPDRLEQCAADLEEAIRQRPRYASALAQLALVHARQSRCDLALKEARRARALSREEALAYSVEALSCGALHAPAGERKAIEDGLRVCDEVGPGMDVKRGELLGLRARVREEGGDRRGAIEDCTHELELLGFGPFAVQARAEALRTRASNLMALGERAAAAADIRAVLELTPDCPDADKLRRGIAELESSR